MLARLSDRLAAFFRATAPDPFVIAVLLTALTFILGLTLTDSAPRHLADQWSGASGVFGKDGVWRLMAFSMQMCLILVTGAALAETRPVSAAIDFIAHQPRTARHAVVLVTLGSCLLGLINWGLGLVGGAILARRVGIQMARRGVPAHYPLLAAAGYMSMLVWHGGLSGTAPLKVTTDAGLKETLGDVAQGLAPIPLTETIFSPLNLIVTGGLIVLLPILMAAMMPATSHHTADRYTSIEEAQSLPDGRGSVERPGFIPRLLEETPIINLMLAAIIAWWAWGYYVAPALEGGLSRSGLMRLTPDSVNLTMLLLALVLHGTPRRFLAAVDEAVKGCGGIIIQFPLYAGIMGMMESSGLTRVLADTIAGGATTGTLPILTLLAATVVGLFIPSGGAQWAVQGPVTVQSGLALGVEPGTLVMAVAYGDQLANMPQPFWALPLLAITGVKAREIIGYACIAMLAAGTWTAVWMMIL